MGEAAAPLAPPPGHLPVLIINNKIKNDNKKIEETSKEKHSSWWDIGIGGKSGVKRRGARF